MSKQYKVYGKETITPSEAIYLLEECNTNTGIAATNRRLESKSVAFILRELQNDECFNLSDLKTIITANSSDGICAAIDDVVSFEDRTGFRADSKTILGSPFNYQDSTLLLIPNDIPDPRDSNHVDCIAKNIHDAAEAAGGRTVALFTAYNALNKAYDQLLPMLDTSELSLHAQGRTGNPDRIIQSLRNDAGSIVLGTSTFWEGIDLRGDALQVLVITKLPFEVPTDPIVLARSEGYPSPFMDYSLPNAVNRFRQGFGRLIRSKEDVGVVILLDPRIVKSRYGSLFIKALPQMEIRHEKSSETAKLVSNWLGT